VGSPLSEIKWGACTRETGDFFFLRPCAFGTGVLKGGGSQKGERIHTDFVGTPIGVGGAIKILPTAVASNI